MIIRNLVLINHLLAATTSLNTSIILSVILTLLVPHKDARLRRKGVVLILLVLVICRKNRFQNCANAVLRYQPRTTMLKWRRRRVANGLTGWRKFLKPSKFANGINQRTRNQSLFLTLFRVYLFQVYLSFILCSTTRLNSSKDDNLSQNRRTIIKVPRRRWRIEHSLSDYMSNRYVNTIILIQLTLF